MVYEENYQILFSKTTSQNSRDRRHLDPIFELPKCFIKLLNSKKKNVFNYEATRISLQLQSVEQELGEDAPFLFLTPSKRKKKSNLHLQKFSLESRESCCSKQNIPCLFRIPFPAITQQQNQIHQQFLSSLSQYLNNVNPPSLLHLIPKHPKTLLLCISILRAFWQGRKSSHWMRTLQSMQKRDWESVRPFFSYRNR